MKFVALLLNAALVCAVAYLVLFKTHFPHGEDLALAILFVAAPVVSSLALLTLGGDTWVGLYFRRKALEEKQKIAALQSVAGKTEPSTSRTRGSG